MLKIKWTERITNKGVLRRVGEKRNIIKSLNRRRGSFIWYILRHSSLLKTVLEGEISGKIEDRKKNTKRSRLEYIGQITRDVKTNSNGGMKRLTKNIVDEELQKTSPWIDYH
jgi:hypothetical protein